MLACFIAMPALRKLLIVMAQALVGMRDGQLLQLALAPLPPPAASRTEAAISAAAQRIHAALSLHAAAPAAAPCGRGSDAPAQAMSPPRACGEAMVPAESLDHDAPAAGQAADAASPGRPEQGQAPAAQPAAGTAGGPGGGGGPAAQASAAGVAQVGAARGCLRLSDSWALGGHPLVLAALPEGAGAPAIAAGQAAWLLPRPAGGCRPMPVKLALPGVLHVAPLWQPPGDGGPRRAPCTADAFA